jgi:hypothetical protein
VITNSFGAITSDWATLTVLVPPTITQQPADVEVTEGSPANFFVAAEGTAPLSYQWQHEDGDLPGATSALLSINSVQASQAGAYRVLVSNSAGVITSAVAVLTIGNADTDGDGMPDLWEREHGFDPGSPLDASLDADTDRSSNLDEYHAGTDPRDPESLLRLEISLTQSEPEGIVTIRFQGKNGRRYTLFYREQIDTGAWQVLAQWGTFPTDQSVTLDDVAHIQRPQRFYRLLGSLQP